MKIPFNKVYTTGNEITYMQDCMDRGEIAGNGYYTNKVQEFIQTKFCSPQVFFTNSGSAALEMASLLINLGPGDEVIMPSFTFSSTANAVMLRGARPVFVDIDSQTLNINPAEIQLKVNQRTKAIIPVHYAGIACEMDKIMSIANNNNLYVIEDAAQGLYAAYKDKYLGTIGHIGCYSFHATKNLVSGEGGAILLNTLEPQLLKRAELILEKGTNRNQFLRGDVDKYTWCDIGSSFMPSDLLAAFLMAQLEEIEQITNQRKKIYDYYYASLRQYQLKGLIRLPIITPDSRSNYHIFYCIFNSTNQRDYVISSLNAVGVQATFHYIPLHSSPMGIKLGYKPYDLPVTEEISSTLLRLPIYPQMSIEEQDYAIENLKNILEKIK